MRVAASLLLILAIGRPASAGTITYRVPLEYPTIQSAVRAVPKNDSKSQHRIKIAPGIYDETVKISENRSNIILEPSGGITDPSQVVIRAGVGQIPLRIYADDVTVENITVEQTATSADGPQQAVVTTGTRVVFDNAILIGNQDTLFLWGSRSLTYLKSCRISGTIDFIYGDGTAFFDVCTIVHRVNSVKPYNGGLTTAPSTPQTQTYGLVFNECTITREEGVPSASAQLYRPWSPYGSAAFINCSLDKHIDAIAWWSDFLNETTNYNDASLPARGYEYESVTLASDPVLVNLKKRPAWVQREFDPAYFSKANVLGGWNP